MLHICRLALVLVAFIFLTGCTGGDITVRGELHRGQQLYKPAEGEQVMITFQELVDGKATANMFPTRLASDGTFQIEGPDNKGIPAGTYRVSIASYPEILESGVVATDKFKGVYENEKSPLKYDISPSQQFIKIEIE